jgi:copper chaperone CopZ
MEQNCHVEPVNKTVLDSALRNADRVHLTVAGMGCQNCAMRVRNALVLLEGVHHAEMYLNIGLAEVYYDSGKVSIEAMVAAVAAAGNDGCHHYETQVISSQPV